MVVKSTKLGGTDLTDEAGKPSHWNDTFDATIEDARHVISLTAFENLAAGDLCYGLGTSTSALKLRKIKSTASKTNLTTGNVTTSPAGGVTKTIALSSTLSITGYISGGNLYLSAASHDASGNVSAVGTELATGVAQPSMPIAMSKLTSTSFAIITATTTNAAIGTIRRFTVSGTTITASTTANITTNRLTAYLQQNWFAIEYLSDDKVICSYDVNDNYTLNVYTWNGSAWVAGTSAALGSPGHGGGDYAQISMASATVGTIARAFNGNNDDWAVSRFSISATTVTVNGTIYSDTATSGGGVICIGDDTNAKYLCAIINSGGTIYFYDITSSSTYYQVRSTTTITPVPNYGFISVLNTDNSFEKNLVYFNSGDLYIQKFGIKNNNIFTGKIFSDTGWNETGTGMSAAQLSNNIYMCTGNTDATAALRPFSLADLSSTIYPEFISTATILADATGKFRAPFTVSNEFSSLVVGTEYTYDNSSLTTVTSTSDVKVGMALTTTKFLFYKVY